MRLVYLSCSIVLRVIFRKDLHKNKTKKEEEIKQKNVIRLFDSENNFSAFTWSDMVCRVIMQISYKIRLSLCLWGTCWKLNMPEARIQGYVLETRAVWWVKSVCQIKVMQNYIYKTISCILNGGIKHIFLRFFLPKILSFCSLWWHSNLYPLPWMQFWALFCLTTPNILRKVRDMCPALVVLDVLIHERSQFYLFSCKIESSPM